MKPFWEDRVRYDDRGQATTTTAAATKLAATAVAVNSNINGLYKNVNISPRGQKMNTQVL